MKPFKGGRAEIAAAATRKSAPLWGMRRSRPPSWSRSRRPVAIWTDPADKKSAPLNAAWLSRSTSAATRLSDASSGCRVASKSPDEPRARRARPMLSVVE